MAEEYHRIRLNLTKHIIGQKGFGHYIKVLKTLIAAVEQVLAEDQEVTESQRKSREAKSDEALDTSHFDGANLRIKRALDALFEPSEEVKQGASQTPQPPQKPQSVSSLFSLPSLASRALPSLATIRAPFRRSPNQASKPWWKKDYPEWPSRSGLDLVTLSADALTSGVVINSILKQQKWMTPYQKLFISKFITGYFTPGQEMYPVHQNMKHAPVKSLDLMDVAKGYIAGAGPFMIKILQQIGNDRDLNQQVKDITQSVFSSIPALPLQEFLYLKSQLALKPEYTNLLETAIGAASIGETHVCVDPSGKEPIAVVKFIKPVSAWMFMCEVDFLLTVLWPSFQVPPNSSKQKRLDSKKCRLLLLFLMREFAREFDVQREAQGTQDAREIYYRPDIGIKTPELLDSSTNPVPALVLGYIKGQGLEDFMAGLKKIPSMEERHALLVPIQRRITVLVGLWLKELFWGGGRFDADPHIGNFIVPSFEEMSNPKSPPWIALIDFGSHGQLDPFMQCVVFKSLYTGSKIVQYNDCVPTPATKGAPLSPDAIKVLLDSEPLAKYFPDLPQMSSTDQLELVRRIKARNAEKPKAHEENRKYIREIITSMWKICDVWDNPDETESLVEKCLDYGKTIDFMFISLRVAQYAETIGVCSWNSVLMYGRGLAYLESLWTVTSADCGAYQKVRDANKRDLGKHLMQNVPDCDQCSLFRVVWPFFVSNPKLGMRMMAGCPKPEKPQAKKSNT